MPEDFGQKFYGILQQELQGIHISNILIITAVALAAAFLIYIIFHNKGRFNNKKELVHLWMTLEYAGVLLLITIFRRGIGERGEIAKWYGFGFGLSGIKSSFQTIIVLLNVFLFVPWGVFISLYGKKKNPLCNIFITTVLGFATSLSIECIQLITGTGFFEVLDIIANSFGAFIGALIGQLILNAVNIRNCNTDIKFH